MVRREALPERRHNALAGLVTTLGYRQNATSFAFCESCFTAQDTRT